MQQAEPEVNVALLVEEHEEPVVSEAFDVDEHFDMSHLPDAFSAAVHFDKSHVPEAFSAEAFEAQLAAHEADLSPAEVNTAFVAPLLAQQAEPEEVNTAFVLDALFEASQVPDAF
jgi:hypothetical protein